jgi:ornithine decarboxylase
MKGPFELPIKIKEGDYIEFGNTGAYSRALASRFNGYGAFDEAILLDEPMLTMYPGEEGVQQPVEQVQA